MKPRSLTVKPPQVTREEFENSLNSSSGSSSSSSSSTSTSHLVAWSYDWMIAVLSLFFDELWVFLKASSSSSSSTSSSTSSTTSTTLQTKKSPSSAAAYSRADICEVEPVAITCILRLLVRFVIELENIKITTLSKPQQLCYLKTIKQVEAKMLPSVDDIMSASFFVQDLVPHAPATVIKTLVQRLRRVLKDNGEK
jgi:hypothetical protein